ncbi:hypothetical protein GCM10010303_31560 [Streptomyces purpurascens]|nr:hypothetical protein GCM10010303_31560 [Streptomyces purpurascens]
MKVGGGPVGRNAVERGINGLKQWRGIATRYEKTATTYLAGLQMVGVFLWSARWSNRKITGGTPVDGRPVRARAGGKIPARNHHNGHTVPPGCTDGHSCRCCLNLRQR